MSTFKEIKISPRQGSFDLSGNKNIIDFDISGGVYDLSQSEVVVQVQAILTSPSVQAPNTAGGGASDTSGIFDLGLLLTDSQTGAYDFVVNGRGERLIKNVEIKSDNLGIIETRINNNVFAANMASILSNEEDQLKESSGALAQFKYKGISVSHPMSMLVGEGAEASEQRALDIRIKLKNILGCSSDSNGSNMYDTGANGDISLHLEAMFQELSLSPFNIDSDPWDKEYNNSNDAGNAAKYEAMEDEPVQNTGADKALTTMITSIKYKDMEDSPFHVGQKLQVNYTVEDAGTIAEQVVQIASIAQITTGANVERLQLTMTGTWCNQPNTKTITATVVKGLTPDTVNGKYPLQINSVELKLMQAINPPSIPRGLQFDYITTHRDNYPGAQFINQTYYIPPMTKCVYVMFPETNLTYSKDNLKSYRITIDSEPLTDRKIDYKSSLHYDLLNKTIINSGNKKLKSLAQALRPWNYENTNTALTPTITLFAFPVQFKQSQQILELDLEGNAALSGNIQLNYERVKQIN